MPNETPPPTNEARLAELVEMARLLVNDFDEFAAESGKQFTSLAKRARTNRRLIFVVLVGCVLDILLTIIIVVTGAGVIANTRRIDALTNRIDLAQTVQRQKALCPLYQVFLDSKSPQARAQAPDPKKYDHAFVVIKQGYDALECNKYITGTPQPVSPSN